MSSLFVAFLSLVASSFLTRAALQAEILALRHQLTVLQKNAPRRPKFACLPHRSDRCDLSSQGSRSFYVRAKHALLPLNLGSESGVGDPTVQVCFKVGLCAVDGLRRPNIDCAAATEQSRLQSRLQL
jgi:hypothetical protein